MQMSHSLLAGTESERLPKVLLRQWTLGDIITSIAQIGLFINQLHEDQGINWAFPKGSPASAPSKLPGTFTLTPLKPSSTDQ
ncbi:hypothetical protein [Bacillus sp. 1P06AnD]|uniref:hypothetical protein n=1 Tax=Bacillus sp. 1P06AnD TaxID=3132208 RepID=UPI00399FFD1E